MTTTVTRQCETFTQNGEGPRCTHRVDISKKHKGKVDCGRHGMVSHGAGTAALPLIDATVAEAFTHNPPSILGDIYNPDSNPAVLLHDNPLPDDVLSRLPRKDIPKGLVHDPTRSGNLSPEDLESLVAHHTPEETDMRKRLLQT